MESKPGSIMVCLIFTVWDHHQEEYLSNLNWPSEFRSFFLHHPNHALVLKTLNKKANVALAPNIKVHCNLLHGCNLEKKKCISGVIRDPLDQCTFYELWYITSPELPWEMSPGFCHSSNPAHRTSHRQGTLLSAAGLISEYLKGACWTILPVVRSCPC